MNCDLHKYFGKLASTLPTDQKQRRTFNSQSFSDLPGFLETDQVVIRKSYHAYEEFKVDKLQFFASRSTYRELGLLILAVVFRPGGAQIHLRLTDPESNIRNLITEYQGKTHRGFSYRTRPEEFAFVPASVNRHPWCNEQSELFSLPTFRLTNLREFVVTEDEWASRDTVMGFGNDDSSVRLAELLLRIGSPLNEIDEVELEGEGGFRGVGIHSAEAVFNLPGSLAWPDGVELSHLFPD